MNQAQTKCSYEIDRATGVFTGYRDGVRSWQFGWPEIQRCDYSSPAEYEKFLLALGYVARGVAAEEDKQIDPLFAAAHYGHDLIPAVQEDKPATEDCDIEEVLDYMIEQVWQHVDAIRSFNAEPKRPALTWAAKTPFDAFPGFATSSHTDAQDSAAKVCATGRFYDEGWNAAHDGLPFDPKTTRDWRDGWNDYQDAGPEHKVRLDGMLSEAVRESTTAKPALAALTRLSDVHAPLHGSAHLVGSAI